MRLLYSSVVLLVASATTEAAEISAGSGVAAMAEWLALLLLVPVIVAPVVLLVGFAGCGSLLNLDPSRFEPGTPPPPEQKVIVIDSADGEDVITIKLTWHSDFALSDLVFDRANPDSTTTTFAPPPTAQPSPFDDSDGLEAAKSYTYTLRDESSGEKSAEVTGTTLGFETTFEATFDPTLDGDGSGWEGYTLVQRIEPAALTPISRTQVKQARITLFAATTSGASIDKISISPANPASAQEYDSNGTPTAVYDPMPPVPLVVAAGGSVTLPPVNYIADIGQPMLIAIDFTPAPPASGVKRAPVMPTMARAWWRAATAEAMSDTRSPGYSSTDAVYLIGRVEIG